MRNSSGSLKRSVRRLERAFTTEWRRGRLARRKSEFKTVTRWQNGPTHPYFVMSDRGLYRTDREGAHRILDIPMYGCAIAGGKVFMTLYIGHDTILVEGDASALFERGKSFGFRPLFSEVTSDTNERMHQVTPYGDGVWVARTGGGAVMRYEIGGDKLLNYVLIRDRFGSPVKRDINHINSVVQYGDVVLFTATHAGRQSMVGMMHGNSVTGFGYKNTGVHDIYLTGDDFLFFDSFGADGGLSGGAPVMGNAKLLPDLFGNPPGYVPRGAAQTDSEIVIGSSHKGKRKNRFKGNGQLIVSDNGKVKSVLTMPVAQIYQIINARGEFLKALQVPPGADKVKQMLERALGAPIYEGEAEVSEIPAGAHL